MHYVFRYVESTLQHEQMTLEETQVCFKSGCWAHAGWGTGSCATFACRRRAVLMVPHLPRQYLAQAPANIAN